MLQSGRFSRIVVAGALLSFGLTGVALWWAGQVRVREMDALLRAELLTQARAAAVGLAEPWPPAADKAAAYLALLRAGAGQVAILASDGRVLAADPPVAQPQNLWSGPETTLALRDGTGSDSRPWGPGQRRHVIVAARIGAADSPRGVAWLARPLEPVMGGPGGASAGVTILVTLTVLGALVFTGLVVRLRLRVLQRAIGTVRRLSAGDLADVPAGGDSYELSLLASELMALRRRLATQVETIDRQRRMLASLVNQLREGVIVARGDGRIALINPTAIRLLNLESVGSDETEFVGRTVEECIPQHQIQVLLAPAEGDATEPEVPADARLEVQSLTGTTHLLVRGSELVLGESGHADGAQPGRVVVLTDISALQRTIQVRTDFVANASHELRTPLSTIRAAVETLLTMDLATEGPAARKFLEKVDRQSARLQQMVADLLDLSRLESPAERFEPERLEIRRLVQDLQARFAEALERRQLAWATVIDPPSLVQVLAHPHLLRLVLDNLVDNAIKFTEPGGQVGLGIRRTNGEVAIEVWDTGCGIAPEEQQRVFERFYQVQRARSGPERGTGLGLSIVRHAVGAMRGRVQLESRPGAGTRVTVTLPQSA